MCVCICVRTTENKTEMREQKKWTGHHLKYVNIAPLSINIRLIRRLLSTLSMPSLIDRAVRFKRLGQDKGSFTIIDIYESVQRVRF